MLSRVLRLRDSQGIVRGFALAEHPNPRRRIAFLASNGKENLTANKFLGINLGLRNQSI